MANPSKRQRVNVDEEPERILCENFIGSLVSTIYLKCGLITSITSKEGITIIDGPNLDLKTEYDVSRNILPMIMKWKRSKIGADVDNVMPKSITISGTPLTYEAIAAMITWTGEFKAVHAKFITKCASFLALFGERIKEMHLGVDQIKHTTTQTEQAVVDHGD